MFYLIEYNGDPEMVLVVGLADSLESSWNLVRDYCSKRQIQAGWRMFHAVEMVLNELSTYDRNKFHYYEVNQ